MAALGLCTVGYHHGASALRQFLFSFKGTTVHPCAFWDHSSELEKNGIWFLQSVAHSKPLESFHKRRCEFSSSAGEHSNHSALTRLHSHVNQKSTQLPVYRLAPHAFYLTQGEPPSLACWVLSQHEHWKSESWETRPPWTNQDGRSPSDR